MARNDGTICRNFVNGEPPKASLFARVGNGNPWGSAGALSSAPGTVRLGYGPKVGNGRSDVLWSYEHYILAIRYVDPNGKVTLILNGDGAPTHTTAQQMRALRGAAAGHNTALIPFSALTAAGFHTRGGTGLRPRIVHTTPDTTKDVSRWCNAGGKTIGGECAHGFSHRHEMKTTVHFLGETLFELNGRLYVCGLDRNDDPRRRNFYLCRLPANATARTVDAALNALRPRKVPKGSPRQGEFFFIPAPKLRVKNAEVVKRTFGMLTRGSRMEESVTGVPILSDDPAQQPPHISHYQHGIPFERARRHRASQLYRNGAVYVRGVMRDDEHGTHKIGDGKIWHRVVKNLADGSWGAARDGHGRGRVD